jgi:transcriptional regulator with GAF, ATPase, and Fis domain
MISASAADAVLLYDIARNLLQEQDYGELLTSILDLTMQALGADRGCIVVREKEGFRASVARNFRNEALSQREHEISHTIANMTVSEGKVLLIDDAQESELIRDKKSVRRLKLRSVLCAPLIASDEAFALIYLENREISNHFNEHHRELLSEICGLAAPRLHLAIAVASAQQKAREFALSHGRSDGIVTADPAMFLLLEAASKVASTDVTVLVQGETGTGKELVARAIYRQSRRAQGSFVVMNCAAIPATLMETELFGCVRGAYTDAPDRVGLIGSANRGTLFLDEVGEMPLELQSRLLRVLQSGEFTRVGSTRLERVDMRVIAATNRDLETEVAQGRFRQDLYFRLVAVTFKIPPLRERTADLMMLADHFLRTFAGRWARPVPRLSTECMQTLQAYPFPGNVRELEGEMSRVVALCSSGEEISASTLSDRLARRSPAHESNLGIQPMSLAEMEKKLIVSVLQHASENRTRAAEILGISREGLRTKMLKHGLSSPSASTESL